MFFKVFDIVYEIKNKIYKCLFKIIFCLNLNKCYVMKYIGNY